MCKPPSRSVFNSSQPPTFLTQPPTKNNSESPGHMDQTNTSTKLNASLFTDDEGESTDTAGSSDEEYRYGVRLIQQFQLFAHRGK